MSIDPERLRQHYTKLSDEELLALNRDDLTDVAQKYYDWEIKRRGLEAPVEGEQDDEGDETFRTSLDNASDIEIDDEEGDMFVASSFIVDRSDAAVGDAEDARHALVAAGIPCRVEVREVAGEPLSAEGHIERQVLVPVEWTLQATSVLDKEIFNPKMEADWKTHLEALSDNQLLALNADDICAGFLDRAERLRKAYRNEIRRRQL